MTVIFRCVDHGAENRYLSDKGCHRGWISIRNFLEKMRKLSCQRRKTMLIYTYRIPLQYGGTHDGKDITGTDDCG